MKAFNFAKKILSLVKTAAVKCQVPGCGGTMVERTNKATGHKFYGCSNFHAKNCKSSMSVAEYNKLENAELGQEDALVVQIPQIQNKPAAPSRRKQMKSNQIYLHQNHNQADKKTLFL
jgi:ssDNA-binding Zn-finger/Zn-ribbon topoisomerase 1